MDNQKKSTFSFTMKPVTIFPFSPSVQNLCHNTHYSQRNNIVSMALQGKHDEVYTHLLSTSNSRIAILEKLDCLDVLLSMNELVYNFFREHTIKYLKNNIHDYFISHHCTMSPQEITKIQHVLDLSMHKNEYGFITDLLSKKLPQVHSKDQNNAKTFTPLHSKIVVKININQSQEQHNDVFESDSLKNYRFNTPK